MPFFDRFWWLETLAALALLGVAASTTAYYVGTVYPDEITFQHDFHESDPTLLILFPVMIALFVALAFIVVGRSFRGQERKRLRRLALAGDLNALPPARFTGDAAQAPDIASEPLVIMWRPRNGVSLAYRAIIAFLLLVLLALAAVYVLLIFVLPSGQPTTITPGFATPLPLVLVQALQLALLVFVSVRDVPKAFGTRTGIAVNDEGVLWHTPWRKHRFLRWEDARLLEVVPTGKYNLCREFILYGERQVVRWQDYIPEFEFSSFSINSKQEYQPDGVSADEMRRRTRAMLNLVAARTGLTLRTLHRRLQTVNVARQQRSGAIAARISFVAMGLLLFGIAAAVVQFPLVGSNAILNLLSAVSLALAGAFSIVFGLILAPLLARNQERTAVSAVDHDPASLDAVPTQPFLRPEDAFALSFGYPPPLRLAVVLVGILLTLGGVPAVPWAVASVLTLLAPILSPGSRVAGPLGSFGASILAWVLLALGGTGLVMVWATLFRFGKTFGWREIHADSSGLHLDLAVRTDVPWDAVETFTLLQRNGQPLRYRVTGISGKVDLTWPARLGHWSQPAKDATPISPAALAILVTRQSGVALQTVEEGPHRRPASTRMI